MNFPNVIGAMPIPETAADAKDVRAAQALDTARLDNQELMKVAGWTAADLTTAATQHGLPPCDAWRSTSGDILNPVGEPTRLRRSVKAWAREQERLAQDKLRLIKKLL